MSDDGRVFCTTTWEEGGRSSGIYHEGDALAHIPSLGISSGESVAVTAHWLAYGQEGKIAVFSRNAAGEHEVASGRHIKFAEGKDAPQVTGLAIDEGKDRLYAADKSGQVRVFVMSTGKPVEGAGFRAVRPGQMRLDAEGNLWLIEKPLEAEFEVIAAVSFGSEPSPPAWAQANFTVGCRRASTASSAGVDSPGSSFPPALNHVCCMISAPSSPHRV